MNRRQFIISISAGTLTLNFGPAQAQSGKVFQLSLQQLWPAESIVAARVAADQPDLLKDYYALEKAAVSILEPAIRLGSPAGTLYQLGAEHMKSLRSLSREDRLELVLANFENEATRRALRLFYNADSIEDARSLLPDIIDSMTEEEFRVMMLALSSSALMFEEDSQIWRDMRALFGKRVEFIFEAAEEKDSVTMPIAAQSDDGASETVVVYSRRCSRARTWISNAWLDFEIGIETLFGFGFAAAHMNDQALLNITDGVASSQESDFVGAMGFIAGTAIGTFVVPFEVARTRLIKTGAISASDFPSLNPDTSSRVWAGPIDNPHEICNQPLVEC